MGRGGPRRAAPVGESLRALVRALGMEGRLLEIDIRRVWSRAVGRSVAGHAQPVRLVGGRLLVHVSDSAWLHRLSLMRRDLARNVNDRLAVPAVKEVRLRLGPLDDPAAPVPDRRTRPPTPADPRPPTPTVVDPILRRALEPAKGRPFEEVVDRILRREAARGTATEAVPPQGSVAGDTASLLARSPRPGRARNSRILHS
jgi:hypothetical protein